VWHDGGARTFAYSVDAAVKAGGAGGDDEDVPKEPVVTPVLDPPRSAVRSTRSAAVTLLGVTSVEIGATPEVEPTDWLNSAYWAEGIDYERWSSVVRTSPRSAFADRLDIVDLLGD
jgi:hypothetical protein